jgi:hypothetical protein
VVRQIDLMRPPNFLVERMAAGGSCVRTRAPGAPHRRSPRRWSE